MSVIVVSRSPDRDTAADRKVSAPAVHRDQAVGML